MVVAFFGLFLFGTNVRAAILTVTTTEDTDDNVCNFHCSLREAIAAAENGDTIIFARNLRGSAIQLNRKLMIEKILTIDGPNRRRITVKGNRTFGIFHIGGSSGTLTQVRIDGLIIRDGAENGGRGGGIYVDGFDQLTLSECLITDNHAAIGGGIRVFLGWLTLMNSTVANNTSDGEGDSAGIDGRMDAGGIEIFNSTISGNIASAGPGGLKVLPEKFLMINSTVVENQSSGNGMFSAGGVWTSSSGSLSSIENSIIARNIGEISDLRVHAASGQYNLIGNGDGSIFAGFDGVNGNIIGTTSNLVDPRLGALENNGGGIPTLVPLWNSPVIDAGSNSLYHNLAAYIPELANRDQRRFRRLVSRSVDIGSVEYGANQLPITSAVLGKIESSVGRPVSRAVVTLRFPNGETRTAITNPFGYYRFAPVPADAEYSIEVRDKRFTFKPQSLLLEETEEYVDFRAN